VSQNRKSKTGKKNQMQEQKQVGVIGQWYSERGFGFIHQVISGNLKTFFCHVTQIKAGIPEKGAPCSFSVGTNTRGECAIEVEIIPAVRS
jgi:cold shock CspA family protein